MNVEQTAVAHAVKEFNNQQDCAPTHEKRIKSKLDGKQKYLAHHSK